MQGGFVDLKTTTVKAFLIPPAHHRVCEPAFLHPVPRTEGFAQRIAVVREVVKKKYQVWFVPSNTNRSAEMTALPIQIAAKPALQELPLPAPDNAHVREPATLKIVTALVSVRSAPQVTRAEVVLAGLTETHAPASPHPPAPSQSAPTSPFHFAKGN